LEINFFVTAYISVHRESFYNDAGQVLELL